MARSSGFDSGNLSDAAVHILLALTKPRHGYAVMQFLHDASHGHIDIGPASLYTTLKKLTAASLITEVDTEENRRIYHITPTDTKFSPPISNAAASSSLWPTQFWRHHEHHPTRKRTRLLPQQGSRNVLPHGG